MTERLYYDDAYLTEFDAVVMACEPAEGGWRLLLSRGEPTEAVVKVYRAALDGQDFRALPQWQILETMNTTAGHYFRGVE